MTEKATSLQRPDVVRDASSQRLTDVYVQFAESDTDASVWVDPAFHEVGDRWDIIWELHDRICAMSAEDGDRTRHTLFEFIRRRPETIRPSWQLESIAILFQTLGEQEQRWHPQRTHQQSYPDDPSGFAERDLFYLKEISGLNSALD